MLPVAELLSVGREPLDRSIWASLDERGRERESYKEASQIQIQTLTLADKCHRLVQMHSADASK